MKRTSGALRIFSYNWPVYVITWVSAALVLAWAHAHNDYRTPLAVTAALFVGAFVALAWSIWSLVVSAYIYDFSELLGGAWLKALLPDPTNTWANVHAGLDAEIDLDAAMPGMPIARLDIFDETIMPAPSIARARRRTPTAHTATPCRPTALALGDETCDAIVVAFTAHEIRDARAREIFFDELKRALRPGGRAFLIEHVRDLANLFAFGPGFLHFAPRAEWLRLVAHSGLAIKHESRVTPFVMALTLERAS